MARRKVPLPPDEILDQLRDELRWRPPSGPRDPQRLGTVVSGLMARYGYGQIETADEREEKWRELVGPVLAGQSRPGNLKRGVLEVIVANSAALQELTFQKKTLLRQMSERLPDHKIRDLRFKVGTIS